jgi:5-methyltetrahydrofolate--homocysteine methyltransferase
MMLYARHLGLKGKIDELMGQGDEKALSLYKSVRDVQDEALANKWFQARAMYQFVPAFSRGNSLILPNTQFEFPRQRGKENRCLSDLVPPSPGDHIALMVTTSQGTQMPIRELADEFKNRGEYLKSHIILALAIETAEAIAEWLHQKLRAMWGFPDDPELKLRDIFAARYRGKRYSFGYPACPNLDDQALLWALLEPQKHINVELTDGFMMDPESSVSALVFHHPQASYFSTLDS